MRGVQVRVWWDEEPTLSLAPIISPYTGSTVDVGHGRELVTGWLLDVQRSYESLSRAAAERQPCAVVRSHMYALLNIVRRVMSTSGVFPFCMLRLLFF